MPNSTAPIRRLHRLRLRNGMYGRHGKVVVAALLVAMAATAPARTDEPTDQDIFWQRLQELCGHAFAGTMTAYDATADADWLGQSIVAHLRRCTADRIEIPLHVGEDRSRTWVLTRVAGGLRLQHDHRHADGSEDAVSWYGGSTRDPGRPGRQVFPADAFSRSLFLARGMEVSVENSWVLELVPGEMLAYALVRSGRHVRLEFGLGEPVPVPPAPWGFEEGEGQPVPPDSGGGDQIP